MLVAPVKSTGRYPGLCSEPSGDGHGQGSD